MDIEDIKEQKARLTEQIRDLVAFFEGSTGVKVSSIGVGHMEENTTGKIDGWHTKATIEVICTI